MEKSEKLLEIEKKEENFKKIHKNTWTITMPKLDESGNETEDFFWCILRKPTRIEMRPVLELIQKDSISANEYLLNAVWLDGDQEIKTDDDLFFGVSTLLGEIITFAQGTIKKN
jgi:hypothetical protein